MPVYPEDGQEVAYAADEDDGIIWHFKYRSTATSPYRWEFIGGAAVNRVYTANFVNVASSTYTSIPAMPAFTIPLTGNYEVSWGSPVLQSQVAALNQMALAVFADGTFIDVGYVITTSQFAGNAVERSGPYFFNAGETLQIRYASLSSQSTNVWTPHLKILPVRVA
jgi:hypothetical protein